MGICIKLGFIGSYKWDILLYLARILRTMEQRVAVIDSSTSQDLKVLLSADDEVCYTFSGVDCYFEGQEIGSEGVCQPQEYDYVLVDYGFNTSLTEELSGCSIVFLVTDFEKHHIERVRKVLSKGWPDKVNLVKIYRDIIESKIRKKYIDHILKAEEKANVLAEYVFERNEEEWICRLENPYEGRASFKHLSKEMKTLLTDIVEEIHPLETKTLQKAMKRAQEDKACR